MVPITIVILIGLFAMQKQRHRAASAPIFGPIMFLWFALAVRASASHRIIEHPGVLGVGQPALRRRLLRQQTASSACSCSGSVVLVVTGGEALYADLGHFGRKPIRLAWFAVVLPALVLNYFGQRALLIADPSALENPFFQHRCRSSRCTRWSCSSTAATVIASQALISGVYSLTPQAHPARLLPARGHPAHLGATSAGRSTCRS